jgi:hypothetical protein
MTAQRASKQADNATAAAVSATRTQFAKNFNK